MKRIAITCALLALVGAPDAIAQLAATRFYNHVDTPLSVTYDATGAGRVVLDPATGGIIDVSGYRRVNVEIGTTQATSLMVHMGKISNTTLSMRFTRPLGAAQIHNFEVMGPQLVLWLRGGPPNGTEQVRLWVYLSS